MTPTPPWLTAYATKTAEDPRLLGTRAKPRHCAKCGLIILAGYDAPLIAGLAIVDPHPLTPLLEAAARILGRATYRLWGSPGTYELTPRQRPALPITYPIEPANAPTVIVLAAHQCGTPPLTKTPLPPPPPSHLQADGPPPF